MALRLRIRKTATFHAPDLWLLVLSLEYIDNLALKPELRFNLSTTLRKTERAVPPIRRVQKNQLRYISFCQVKNYGSQLAKWKTAGSDWLETAS